MSMSDGDIWMAASTVAGCSLSVAGLIVGVRGFRWRKILPPGVGAFHRSLTALLLVCGLDRFFALDGSHDVTGMTLRVVIAIFGLYFLVSLRSTRRVAAELWPVLNAARTTGAQAKIGELRKIVRNIEDLYHG